MSSGESSEKPHLTERLMPIVHKELHDLAARYLSKERKNHTLQPTELVNEAYLRIARRDPEEWEGRTHFFATAARAVRQVLVDHARKHKAQKRGEGRRMVTLHDFSPASTPPVVDVLALDEALTRLSELNDRQHQVVELRFFGGLQIEEIAAVLGVSERTVRGDWRVARAWLIHELRAGEER